MKLEIETTTVVSAASLALNLWLVDDNEEFRRALAEQFKQAEELHGIRCERQFSSAEALLTALAAGRAPDVILSDVQMPGIGGVRAIAPIKRLAPRTRVLMLTTFYNPVAARQARADGAEAFLLKHSPFEELLEQVKGVLSIDHVA